MSVWISNMPRPTAFRRNLFILAHDSVMASAAMASAFWLRYAIVKGEFFIDDKAYDVAAIPLYSGLFGLIALIVFATLRVYRDSWSFTSLRSLGRILQGVALTALLFSLVAFLLTRGQDVPRTVPLIASVFLIAYLLLPRILRRLQRKATCRAGQPLGLSRCCSLARDRAPTASFG
jgi:FlaA1/EpsC-like NDP-sugar epimerase